MFFITVNESTITKPLPKMLEDEDKIMQKYKLKIVYLGEHPDIPGCDVYRTKDVSGVEREIGFPTAYLVRGNEYDKIDGHEAIDIIVKVSEKNNS